MHKFIKKNNLQIIKFLISGGIASFINFLIYSLIYNFLDNIIFASFFGYSAGLLVSFIFAKFWVFKKTSKQKLFKSFFAFCLIYFLGGIEMSFVIFASNLLIKDYRIAWLFGAFIGSLNNYLGSKYFLFK